MQVFTNSITETQDWDWIYKFKISLLIIITISLNIQRDKFVYRSVLETTIRWSFSSQSMKYPAINWLLQNLSTLTIAKVTISTRTNITSQQVWNNWQQLRCVPHSPLFVGMTVAVIISLRTCFARIQCSGKLCLHKITFQSFGGSDYQCPLCVSMCQVRNFPSEHQINSVFLSFVQGVHIFAERPKSIQDIIGDVFCPGKYCFNREKRESLDRDVAKPRSIYICGKWGAWLFVHKVPFTLQEHVKTTITDKNRFFLVKKGKLVTRQTIIRYCPISINQKEKEKVFWGQQSPGNSCRCVMPNM